MMKILFPCFQHCIHRSSDFCFVVVFSCRRIQIKKNYFLSKQVSFCGTKSWWGEKSTNSDTAFPTGRWYSTISVRTTHGSWLVNRSVRFPLQGATSQWVIWTPTQNTSSQCHQQTVWVSHEVLGLPSERWKEVSLFWNNWLSFFFLRIKRLQEVHG